MSTSQQSNTRKSLSDTYLKTRNQPGNAAYLYGNEPDQDKYKADLGVKVGSEEPGGSTPDAGDDADTPPPSGANQIKTMDRPSATSATAATYQPSQGQARGYIAQASDASSYNPASARAASYSPASARAASYEAKTGKSSNYTADQRSVGADATVKSQMEGLLSEGSRYLDVVRNKAAQQANSRGLLNTSMAAGAGERAAIESALPIASQDASTYNNQSLTNQAASNQSRQYNAGNDQQMTLANMNAQNTAGQYNASNRQQTNLANQAATNRAGEYNAGNRQQANLANQNAFNQAGQFNAGQEQQNSQFNAQSANQAGQFSAQQDNAMSQFNANSQNNAGQFNAQSEQQASEFNASQANQMLQEQWSQESAQAHDSTMAELNASLEKGIIDQKAYANLRGQFLDSISELARERAISINEIQTSAAPKEAKEQMIDNLRVMHEADLEGTAGIYAQMPMWQKNWSEAFGQSEGGEGAIDTSVWNSMAAAEEPEGDAA